MAACCFAATAVPSGAAGDECAVWPGEPSPLPRVDDPVARTARWAELRAEELVNRAQLAEPDDPMESLRLWRRVLCLDPTSAPARNGVWRTRPVRMHQPEVRWGGRGRASRRDPWGQLALAVSVPAPVPELSRATRERLATAESLIGASEASLAEARFQLALDRAREADDTLSQLRVNVANGARLRARSAVAAGTAHIALGDADAARASFDRALEAQPRLALDPNQTSPKVIEAFEAVRASREAAR